MSQVSWAVSELKRIHERYMLVEDRIISDVVWEVERYRLNLDYEEQSTENQIIGYLIAFPKYEFINHSLIASIVRDVLKEELLK